MLLTIHCSTLCCLNLNWTRLKLKWSEYVAMFLFFSTKKVYTICCQSQQISHACYGLFWILWFCTEIFVVCMLNNSRFIMLSNNKQNANAKIKTAINKLQTIFFHFNGHFNTLAKVATCLAVLRLMRTR